MEVSEEAWDAVLPYIIKLKVISSRGTVAVSAHGARSTDQLRSPQEPSTALLAACAPVQEKCATPSDFPFRFFVRGVRGELRCISTCSPKSTAADLKSILQDETGFPVDDHYLIHAGKPFEDGMTLEASRVAPYSTLQMMVRLRGAKPIIYLYPPEQMRITARLSLIPEWHFSAIYPVVDLENTQDGQKLEWAVDAKPNGTLTELVVELEVSYLFWEAE